MELNTKHADVLRRMVATDHGELVSGTTDDDYTAHHATLRAMERRGLVTISTRREGDGWAGPKTLYKFARITGAGRTALKVDRDPVTVNGAPAVTAYVDVVERGKGLVTLGNGEGGTVIRQGAGYVVEDDLGILIGRAKSYREGAALVAEHYGVEITGVDVEDEWREYKRR